MRKKVNISKTDELAYIRSLNRRIGKHLTESEAKVITEEEEQNVTTNGLINEDELMEYARLDRDYTGITTDIYVDDGGAYKRYEHPLWVYVQNGYSEDSPYFPVVVSEKPELPSTKLNISSSDAEAILTFISINAKLLTDFANENIEHEAFYNSIKPVIYNDSEYGLVNEMATLRPKVSGLPTVLWIDEGTSPKHGARIKFKASNEQTTTLDFSTMTISQNPEIYNLPKKTFLDTDDLRMIADFVKANEENLLKVAKKELKFQDFLKIMISPKNNNIDNNISKN